LWASLALAGAAKATVKIQIDPLAENHPIGSLVFGANEDYGPDFFKERKSPKHDTIPNAPYMRMGGNRFSAFNWENSASNSGKDWGPHSNDFAMLEFLGLPTNDKQGPGTGVTQRFDQWRALGHEVMATLQIMGPVSGDGKGLVKASEKAPGPRWKTIKAAKGAPFSLRPDVNDPYVYMDEYVNFLVTKYGPALSGGIKYYSLDNEPGYWKTTHPYAHPVQATYREVTQKGIETARAILAVDPGIQVFGPALWGYSDMKKLDNDKDAAAFNPKYGWFVGYYLDQLRQASTQSGKRLLHYLDVHYYPETRGSDKNRIIYESMEKSTTQACATARMQAPRSLWDPSYNDGSWISDDLGKQAIKLIPRLNALIDHWYPQTKLSISEYSFGGSWDVSGGIAQADTLGIFSKFGVVGNYWGTSENQDYVRAAYNLWLDYDGKQSKMGDIYVKAETSDIQATSAYATRSSTQGNKIWVLALNKNYSKDEATELSFRLQRGQSILSVESRAFDSKSASIHPGPQSKLRQDAVSTTLPARSASVFVVTLSKPFFARGSKP
jgi:hypothetical protein